MKEFMKNTIEKIKEKSKNKFWLVPFILQIVWILDTIISLFNTGFIQVDTLFIVVFILKLAVLGTNIFFLRNLFIKDNSDREQKKKLYHYFKSYAGYAVIFVYVAYSLPRMSWEIQNLITGEESFTLWIFTFISSLWIFALYWIMRFSKTQVAWDVLTTAEHKAMKQKKKSTEKVQRTAGDVIIENVHVVIQAIISVIIIQHFFFQMYEIPSESMVPTFLVRDRVWVNKFSYGPTLPLTNWHLPSLNSLERGNIVVFESPEYEQNDVMKKIFHQFVFYLTLSTVDIDRTPGGEIRKQLLVKRLVGLPGEKIKMIDDVVYIKSKNDKEFRILEEDKKFARTNLHKEPYETVKKIQLVITDEDNRNMLDKWDAWKKNTSLESLNQELKALSAKYHENLAKVNPAKVADYFEKILLITFPGYKNQLTAVKEHLERTNIRAFEDIGIYIGVESEGYRSKYAAPHDYAYLLFWEMMKDESYRREFKDYLMSTIESNTDSQLDDYELNCRKLNLKMKIMLAQKYNRYLDLFVNKVKVNDAKNTVRYEVAGNDQDYIELYVYIQHFYDYRNFYEYPTGKNNYITEGKYFLMGDNRYNSLDFRYSHQPLSFRSLDKKDSYSIKYLSSLDLHLLDKEKILGTGAIRVWPFDRFGVLE